MAKSTKDAYSRAWDKFQLFHKVQFYEPFPGPPISSEKAQMYVSFLDLHGYAPSTILHHLSALGFIHKINNVDDPLSHFAVNRAVQNLMKRNPADSRLPITLPILQVMLNSVDKMYMPDYEKILLQCLFTLAFAALLRISEISHCSTSSHNLQLHQITIDHTNIISIHFQSFKHSKKPCIVRVQDNSQVKPNLLSSLGKYLSLRGNQPGPFFVTRGGAPLARSWISKMMKQALKVGGIPAKNFASHSFRIGGATQAALNGFSEIQIKELGRWSSMAFTKYIRPYMTNPVPVV